MSTSVEPLELAYPDKPDANGYAKKYFKRRAFYFGAHNSPESFVLFGEWKRRLVETGVATEVKTIRRELAQQSIASPHMHLGGPVERKPLQLAVITTVASVLLFGAVLASAKILSSTMGPTVDGITLTNEEIDFIRGVRLHRSEFVGLSDERPARIAELTARLMEEGPKNAQYHRSQASL